MTANTSKHRQKTQQRGIMYCRAFINIHMNLSTDTGLMEHRSAKTGSNVHLSAFPP